MPRKVFISVLGTGFYGACQYKRGKFVSTKTRFIQQATIEYLNVAEEWTSFDRILILLTDGARKYNWDKSIISLHNVKTNEDELYFDLTHSYRYLPMQVLHKIKGVCL